ncbi:uncharacterized protein [Drosophila pseudoobscura]|uniref:Uncharacterized protein n=3 Tax=pseudoobscura subgroup TaxID=32358 RepID=A0A6I8W210_DROPS|nr:uncharacterized protein LOC4817823 [Drosophila pseudoobscura]
MVDMHEVILNFIVCFYQTYLLFRQIRPIKKMAALLVLHNILLYYVINMFKHLAQSSIGSTGPVNTFYYVPFVYETPAVRESGEDWHVVLTTPQWRFFESLFRHHLALLLPFNLALLVPNCKRTLISALVLASNCLMFVCFTSAICHWVSLCGGLYGGLRLMPIVVLGPVCQMVLIGFFMARIWVDPVLDYNWDLLAMEE